MERESVFSFSPVLRLRGVKVPQPGWAGKGNLAEIDNLRIRLSMFGALLGQAKPQLVSASGVRLNLVRDADGRENWRKEKHDGGTRVDLAGAHAISATVDYRDALQKRSARLNLSSSAAKGFRVAGKGLVDGNPITLSGRAPPLDKPGAWDFEAGLDGAALTMRVKGRMDAPLQTEHMSFRMETRATDLKLIDRVIEAGLFGTQPVTLSAEVRHDAPKWVIRKLTGTVGTSDIGGDVTVDKVAGRTRIDADVRSRRLDFDDLASNSGNAEAIALERREGLKLVPNTRVNIAKIDKTDGTIRFRADSLFSKRRSSSLTGMSGTLTLERQLLTIKPFTLQLKKGVIDGQIVVNQRGRPGKPLVTLALDMRESSIGALSEDGGGEVDARVDARVRVTGAGDTIREAVGNSDGTVGIVAREGSLPAKMAALLGFDIGRRIFASGDDRATLNCSVLRQQLAKGIGTVSPLIVDTSASQTRGRGTIGFPEESISIILTGAPKRDSLLRLPGSVNAVGTIRDPRVIIPPSVKSVGNIFKAIGRAITGNQGPTAEDADCPAWTERALGR